MKEERKVFGLTIVALSSWSWNARTGFSVHWQCCTVSPVVNSAVWRGEKNLLRSFEKFMVRPLETGTCTPHGTESHLGSAMLVAFMVRLRVECKLFHECMVNFLGH